MKQPILYGIIILFGLVAVVGSGITTFLLGERLLSQKVVPTKSPELTLVEPKMKEFKLVVKETEVNFSCPTEPIVEQDQTVSNLTVVLMNELPDPVTSSLVSISGCPLTSSCASQAETVKQTY